MHEVDKSIIQFLTILRNYEIELVCYSGTAINIYRDNHFKYDRSNWNNFFFNHDLYIEKFLNLRNPVKRIEIKKEIEEELNKINWSLIQFKVNPSKKFVRGKNRRFGFDVPLLRFRNINSGAKLDLHSYLSYDEKKYYGLNDFCFIDKRFFTDPEKIYIDNFYVFIPNFVELYLKSIYGNWTKKNKKAKRKKLHIYLTENSEDVTIERLSLEGVLKHHNFHNLAISSIYKKIS